MSVGRLDDLASDASGLQVDRNATSSRSGFRVDLRTRDARPMAEGMASVRESLRAATDTAHRRLDAAMSSFDLGVPTGYRAFLEVHRTSLRILSDRWGPDEHGDFEAMLAHVEADLGGDEVAPAPACRAPDPAREAGVAYVLRGSRIGAAVLRPRVAAGMPSAYLAFQTVLTWPAFLVELEASGPRDDRQGLRETIDAAGDAFLVFADAVSASPASR